MLCCCCWYGGKDNNKINNDTGEKKKGRCENGMIFKREVSVIEQMWGHFDQTGNVKGKSYFRSRIQYNTIQ